MASQEKPVAATAGAKAPDELLALIARRRATAGPARHEGGSMLYETGPGWEAAIIARDPAVRRVTTSFALEEAFADPAAATIFIPRGAAITLTVARRVCSRHGLGKTVFYEGDNDE
jgi:hypothetical protein